MAARAAAGPVVRGAAQSLLGEALVLPTGLVTAAYLARALGPGDYGRFALAALVVAWVQWSLSSCFARAAIREVRASGGAPATATLVLRLQVGAGALAGLLLCAAAGGLAALLREPALAAPLRLFALDLPLFAAARAHQHLLIGRGDYGHRARMSAARWLLRMLLVVALVAAGGGILGAVLGCIGASLGELLVARRRERPRLRGPQAPWQPLVAGALPLAAGEMALRLFERLDLLLYKGLGASADQAGWYAAAHNLALVPGLMGLAVSPVVLSALLQHHRRGESAQARELATGTLRLVLVLLGLSPLLVLGAKDVVGWLFGPTFAPAAPLFARLACAALALLAFSLLSAVLIAAGRVAATLWLALPLVPLALAAHAFAIPRAGGAGAALASAILAAGAALAALAVALRAGLLHLPGRTLARSLVVGVGLAGLAQLPGGPLPGPARLALLALAGLVAYVLLGERLAPRPVTWSPAPPDARPPAPAGGSRRAAR